MKSDNIIVRNPKHISRLDLDIIERVLVTLLLGLLASRLIPAAIAPVSFSNIILLVSEGVVVVFVAFRRRTTAISHRSFDWFVGFAGTLCPLLVIPATNSPVIPIAYCASLMFTGFAIQLWAKLTLRRSFGLVAANRGVKVTGPYQLVRHPMYAGYILTHVGFLLSGPSLWNLAIYSLTFSLLVARILAEERILSHDPAYWAMARNVRWRVIPLLF